MRYRDGGDMGAMESRKIYNMSENLQGIIWSYGEEKGIENGLREGRREIDSELHGGVIAKGIQYVMGGIFGG